MDSISCSLMDFKFNRIEKRWNMNNVRKLQKVENEMLWSDSQELDNSWEWMKEKMKICEIWLFFPFITWYIESTEWKSNNRRKYSLNRNPLVFQCLLFTLHLTIRLYTQNLEIKLKPRNALDQKFKSKKS